MHCSDQLNLLLCLGSHMLADGDLTMIALGMRLIVSPSSRLIVLLISQADQYKFATAY